MTVGEVIRRVEKSRPGSELSRNEFFDEINRCALDIYENIISRHENAYPRREYTDEGDELDVGDNYADIYVFRLIAKIDLSNGDITRYTNNMLLYNNLMSEYSDHYNRSNMPKSNARMRWC